MPTLALALKNWQALIGGVVALALGIALYTTRHTLEDRTAKLDAATEWQANVRSITSRAADIRDVKGNPALLALDQVPRQIGFLGDAIITLKQALDAKNAETEARGKSYADAKAGNDSDVATADARAKADEARMRTLDALSKPYPGNESCRAPTALLDSLKGL